MPDVPEFQRPRYLTILTPLSNGKIGRGSSMSGRPRTYRMSDEQYAVLEDAAKVLDITPAEFIRWVLYMTANEVLAQKNQQEKK